ncbi:MAG: beta-ribofuranosylaminobenzene 5'-phosphate synthase [Metallosphaera yellowstonensis]|jgi:beta-ribofuranosylaminobenzene 5'-phosphate synthase|uniref:Beta-ribofuranosylaminobenzene 5'-phosphate synthase n=1 Tax=Metallosphaera yellowstonensis MK1 TaxID=671065 RepID=H2C829_9CREN|nr:beta-ribofuranosylaminobenzene 5'-phosphate synthase family protein [Metallosphaera yellowstonensis]EHP68305.1 beta-RFAP synthase [Metallosphaera yellowstonensis MK1]
MLRVIGLSRIHITLFDLEGKHGRIDGGMGVGLRKPRIVLRTGDCSTASIPTLGSVSYCIEEDYEAHVGLGHTTQFNMALAKLGAEYHMRRLDAFELAKLVRRGSTSGVGVYAFEWGGFVVDGGHSIKTKKKALPSDYSDAPPPPLLIRKDFPWMIYAVIPDGKRVFGEPEKRLFENFKPEGTDELARVVLIEFIPSVVEKDLEGVLDALWKIQSLGFKKVEVSHQTQEVREVMRRMYSRGFPCGLSSFGPTVFTFISSRREGEELISTFGGWVSEPNNEGAKVEWY